MSPELEEFRQRILKFSETAVSRAPKIDNEAKTNTSLVQPFLAVLGYDVANPDEVSPEHHADFSEKYQNKVDYAILSNGAPVIAIESKRVGTVIKDEPVSLRAISMPVCRSSSVSSQTA
jgi:predicted type IV restriction endonuclease